MTALSSPPADSTLEAGLASPEAESERTAAESALPETPDMAAILLHGEQVAVLVDRLFADLAPLHKLDETWARRLHEAARLHDIGLAEGRKGHHKAGMRLIDSDLNLDLAPEDRPFVALLTRYHRKGRPSKRQRRFAALSRRERKAVRRCAALLRIADALDYTHAGLISGLDVHAGKRTVRLHCHCGARADDVAPELDRARKKAALFRRVFDRNLELTCLPL